MLHRDPTDTAIDDAAAGQAYIHVNDGPAVNISALNHRAGHHPVVPVQLLLEHGDVNTITVGSVGTEGKKKKKKKTDSPALKSPARDVNRLTALVD